MHVIDGHNDTLLDLYSQNQASKRTFFEQSDVGHIDLPRAKLGGLAGGFFAIFVPSPSDVHEKNNNSIPPSTKVEHQRESTVDRLYAQQITQDMIDLLYELESQSGGEFSVVFTADELAHCIGDNRFAAILHFGGAECIEPDLDNLQAYYDAGLRSLGITWSRSNAFGAGVPFKHGFSPDTGPGLTDAGKQLIKACNDLGIMIDLSHLNEKGFWDVHQISNAPLVATHSNAHAISPATRNLTDEQIDAIGNTEGIIGINFHVEFVRPDGKSDPNTPMSEIIKHVDYIVERIGIDHVGIGSDFDGARMPAELKDARGLPSLLQALSNAGYDQPSLKKITHENWIRVLKQTWKN